MIHNNKEADTIVHKFKQAGLKMTPQRLATYRVLLGSRDHPYANSIYRKVRRIFSHISFDTVNRTLSTFSKMGIVRVVEGRGDPRRFDPNPRNHHHFRCMKCNTIIDFANDSWDRLRVPPGIEKQHAVLSKKVLLEGICNKCRTK